MSRIYSILDSGHCDADLSILDSGTILTPNTSSISAHRMCRGTVPLFDSVNQFETMAYGSGSLTNGALGAVYVGIVNSSAPTNKYVGEDANGYGYRFDDGKIYHNGSSVASLAISALNDIVYIYVNLDAALPTLSVFNGTTLLGTISISTGGTWYPALTVSGGTALLLNLFFNAGQKTFQYPNPTTAGWWDSVAQPSTIYLSTSPYLTQSGDDLSTTRFDAVKGRIVIDANFNLPRGCDFWFDAGDSSAATSIGTFGVEDPDGTYDYLLDHRNSLINIYSLAQGDSFNNAVIEGSLILDYAETNGDQAKRVYTADPIAALLDLPFQKAYFLPNKDASVVDTPLPVVLGVARNFDLICFDAVNFKYQFSDVAIGAIGTVRFGGILQVLGTGYTLNADGAGITASASPSGRAAAEISSVPQGVPPSPTDLLSGAGAFYTFSSNTDVDANWTRSALGDPSNFNKSTLITSAGHGQLEFSPFGSGYDVDVKTNTNIVTNGNTFAVKLTLDQIPRNNLAGSNAKYFWVDGFPFYGPVTNWGVEYYHDTGQPYTGGNVASPGTVTVTFTNNTGSDLPLCIVWLGGGGAGSSLPFLLNDVELYQLPSALDTVPLNGLTLESYMRAVLTRAGWAESQWASADAAAIDTATGYTIGNYFTNSVVTVRNALQPALDSFGAAIYTKKNGVLGVVRLIDPDTVSGGGISGTIDETDFMTEPHIYLDKMRALTTNAKGTRNFSPYTDSDFLNATTDPTTGVPLQVRKVLERDYQNYVSSGTQLAEPYQQAQLAAARPTLFDLRADLQTENERIAQLATVARKFYAITVTAPSGNIYEVGQVWTVSYKENSTGTAKRYLDGQNVFIRYVIANPALQTATLICWR